MKFDFFSASFVICGSEGNGRLIDESNGTYDGMIGCVQRGEVDFFTQFIRPDSIPLDIGFFVVFSEMFDGPRIYSKKSDSISLGSVDILYLLTNLNRSVWEYFFISLEMCTILFFILNIRFKTNIKYCNIKYFQIIQSHFYYYFKYFEMFFSVLNECKHRMKSSKVLYFFIIVSFFHGFHIVLLNTLSSDLTVTTSTREIETLHDLLYDDEFQHIKPSILRLLNMNSLLSNTRPKTDERALFQRIISKGNIVEFASLSDMISTATKIFNDIAKGEIALIENSQMVDFMSKFQGCLLFPETLKNITASKEDILPSSLGYLISKRTIPNTRKIFEYRTITIAELGLLTAYYQVSGNEGIKQFLNEPKDPMATNICMDQIDGAYMKSTESTFWNAFPLDPFHRLIAICFLLVSLSIIVLIIEFLIGNNIDMDKRKIENGKQRNHAMKYISELHVRLIYGSAYTTYPIQKDR